MNVRAWAMRVAALLCGPLALYALGSIACRGAKIPGPETGDHSGPNEGMCVPYPPPAAKVEELPPQPNGDSVWVDGEWEWQTRRYTWKPGGWIVPPPRSFYARSKLERMPNGALAFFPGHWHAPHTEADADIDAGLHCPDPPKAPEIVAQTGDGGGAAPKPGDADEDAEDADVHVGPVLLYAADAPVGAAPKVIFDATLPSDAAPDAPPEVIQPPD